MKARVVGRDMLPSCPPSRTREPRVPTAKDSFHGFIALLIVFACQPAATAHGHFPRADDASGVPTYYLEDAMHSVIGTADGAGVPVAHFHFDAIGNVRAGGIISQHRERLDYRPRCF
jgi:hypothetical protein